MIAVTASTQLKLMVPPALMAKMQLDATKREITVQAIFLELAAGKYGVTTIAPARGRPKKTKPSAKPAK